MNLTKTQAIELLKLLKDNNRNGRICCAIEQSIKIINNDKTIDELDINHLLELFVFEIENNL